MDSPSRVAVIPWCRHSVSGGMLGKRAPSSIHCLRCDVRKKRDLSLRVNQILGPNPGDLLWFGKHEIACRRDSIARNPNFERFSSKRVDSQGAIRMARARSEFRSPEFQYHRLWPLEFQLLRPDLMPSLQGVRFALRRGRVAFPIRERKGAAGKSSLGSASSNRATLGLGTVDLTLRQFRGFLTANRSLKRRETTYGALSKLELDAAIRRHRLSAIVPPRTPETAPA